MTRSEQQQQIIRGCVILFAVIACAFLWLAILSHHPFDYPSPHIYPQPETPYNAAGMLGAIVSYHLFVYLGKGVYAALGGFTLALFVLIRQGRLPHLWQRVIGIALLICVASATAHLMTGGDPSSWLHMRGGVLGYALSSWLSNTVGWIQYPILLYCLLVGLFFTAEGAMMKLPGEIRKRSGQLREMAEEYLPPKPQLASVAGPLRRVLAAIPSRRTPESGRGASDKEKTSRDIRINAGKSRYAEAKKSQETLWPEAEDDVTAVEEAGEEDTEVEEVDAEGDEAGEDGDDEYEYEYEYEYEDEDGEGEDEAEDEDVQEAPLTPEPQVKVVAPVKLPTNVPDVRKRPYPMELAEWDFPSIGMLEEPEYTFSSRQEEIVREKAKVLEKALQEYKIEAVVVEIDTGPVITMFEIKVAPGVKVSQISSLANDLARALRAPSIRVVAPIPGKSTIGIEVPNVDKEKVRMKELMTLGAESARKMTLPLFLGKDASGQPLIGDLAGMPHMLIAGTTGSGKSVCINSIVMSILMTQRPDMVKLILVDPKMVEMSLFKEVPHLMCPIVTEMDRAEKILEWATEKMDERYALLAEAAVRNIAAYNRLTREEKYERFQPASDEEREQIPMNLPYVVIIIDELADMMMMSAKEVELHLSRLAQKSRAVGIHIIVATQRPEAKIVTGLIKSNLPCRIAFRVASRMDSRIVLDQNGAEVLMGQGDMLYLPPGSSKLVRSQGTYLEDNELREVINDLKGKGSPEFHPELMRLKTKELSEDGPRDDLFDKAVEIVLQTKRGSVSLLQRKLTIGYSRASRLIEEMAAAGIVGDYKGSQAREVMITPEEWADLKQREADRLRDSVLSGGDVPDDMFDDDL